MIAIINYGLGNIQAFVNVYRKLHIDVRVANEPGDLVDASKLILPGVGAFDHAMKSFNDSGMREDAECMVLDGNVPVLGICVGMQMLADSSVEGSEAGLGWIGGKVLPFTEATGAQNLPIPHMGWNDVTNIGDSPLFSGLEDAAKFYFLHSYFFECANSSQSIAISNYGVDFSCAVNSNNVYGVQFHPEKSHHFGVQLLKNFSDI
ncbi:MAG: imidazole glycerol phosphate synthase subunit HisH [Pseudomonadota bacterium]